MDKIYALLKLFGERYVFCDDDQAFLDAKENREEMAATYAAILEYLAKGHY